MKDQDKKEMNEITEEEPVEVGLKKKVEFEPVKPEPIGSESVNPEPVKSGSVEDKKKVNKPAIFFGILALIFAGVSVFFGIEYFKPKESSCENNCEMSALDDGGDRDDGDSETAKVESMAEQYKEVEDVIDDLTVGIGVDWSYTENSEGLTYKPEGFNTFITMKLDIVKRVIDQSYTDSNAMETNLKTLKTRFEDAGFSSLGILPFLGSAGTEIYGYLDASRNIVYGMYRSTEFKAGGELNYYYVALECAKTNWILLTEADKDLILGLETAYYEKEGKYPSVIYGIRDIENSQYTPYQTLNVRIGGGYALFYRVSPEEKWQYFAGGQSALPCSDYNTEDLKKAFAGNVCYEGDQEITVQP